MLARFLQGFWQFITATKNAVGNIVFLTIIGVIIASVLTSESVSVPDSAALVINPKGIVVEQKQAVDPMAQFLAGYENDETETLLRDVLGV